MKILIVDDDELDRLLVIRTFKDTNKDFTFIESDSGKKGIELAKMHRYDAILLDYNLPDINGLDVLDHLSTENSYDNAVIMLSGHKDLDLAKKAIDKGAYDFFIKSDIDVDRLLRAVSKATHLNKLKIKDKKDRKELQKLVELDSLTGLSNRYDFELSFNKAFERAKRGSSLAILLLDIDNFKYVNDTFGHDAGDMLLKEFSNRLKDIVRDSDLVARLGGDEFVVLMQDFKEDTQAVLLADRIINAFSLPIYLASSEWLVTTSIGIALYGTEVNTPADLLKCADIAMYRSKENGRNQSQFYSKKMHQSVTKHKQMQVDLNLAIGKNELSVKFCAIKPINSGCTHVLAMLFWNHKNLGELNSEIFNDIAVKSGMLNKIYLAFLHLSLKKFSQLIDRNSSHGYPQYSFDHNSKLFLPISVDALETIASSKLLSRLLRQYNLNDSVILMVDDANMADASQSSIDAIKPTSYKDISFALSNFGKTLTRLTVFSILPIQFVMIDLNQFKSPLLRHSIIRFCQSMGCTIISKAIRLTHNNDALLGIDYIQSDHSLDGEPINEAVGYSSE